MLAVVEHQQQLPPAQVLDQTRQQRTVALLAHPNRGSYGGGHQFGVGNPGQLRQPDAVPVPVNQAPGDLQRQSRLAQSSRSDQRDQPIAAEQPLDLFDIVFAADKAGERDRHVVPGCAQRRRGGQQGLGPRLGLGFVVGHVSGSALGTAVRLLARLSWIRGWRPAEIGARYPDTFGDVADVYRFKRNLVDRLRHGLKSAA